MEECVRLPRSRGHRILYDPYYIVSLAGISFEAFITLRFTFCKSVVFARTVLASISGRVSISSAICVTVALSASCTSAPEKRSNVPRLPIESVVGKACVRMISIHVLFFRMKYACCPNDAPISTVFDPDPVNVLMRLSSLSNLSSTVSVGFAPRMTSVESSTIHDDGSIFVGSDI